MKHIINNSVLPVKTIRLIALFMLMLTFSISAHGNAQSSTLEEIDEAQSAWEALNIENYLARFQYASLWNVYNVQVRVENGFVEDVRMSCMPGLILDTCNLPDLEVYTFDISRLFELARESVEMDDQWTSISYDETYHFPTNLNFNDPDIFDEEWGIRVTLFEIITPSDETPMLIGQFDLAEAESSLSDDRRQPEFDETLDQWIDDTQADWEALDITDYQLAVRWSSIWTNANISLRVTDGYVTDLVATCDNGLMGSSPDETASCWLPAFTPNDYTVSGLFEQARMITGLTIAEDSEPLAFDATYSFPTMIVYDEMLTMDEEWSLQVTHFSHVEDNSQD